MSKLSCTITSRSINVVLGGRMRTIPKGHMNFAKIEKLLRKINALETAPVSWRDAFRSRSAAVESAEKRLHELLDVPVYVEKVTAGRVRVTDKGVLFNDAPLHNAVTEQIMKLMKAGQDIDAMANFLDRLMKNPIQGVQDDLYAWIENGGLALTPDGCFLAFKKVGPDYASGHPAPDGSKVYNHIGSRPEMPREEVNTDRNHTCSQGLHFCSFEYLPKFGIVGDGSDRVVILKIAPEDVVAIPTDYNRSKGRTWVYDVIGEVPEEECEGLFDQNLLVTGTVEEPLGSVTSNLEHLDVSFWDDFQEPADDHVLPVAFSDEDWAADNDKASDEMPPYARSLPSHDKNEADWLNSREAYMEGYTMGIYDAEKGFEQFKDPGTVEDEYDVGYTHGRLSVDPDAYGPVRFGPTRVPVYRNGKIVAYEEITDDDI